jgi:hypothetical protein
MNLIVEIGMIQWSKLVECSMIGNHNEHGLSHLTHFRLLICGLWNFF